MKSRGWQGHPPPGESALLFLIRDIFILVLPPRSKENLCQQVSVEHQARYLQTPPLGPSVAPGLIDVRHRRGNWDLGWKWIVQWYTASKKLNLGYTFSLSQSPLHLGFHEVPTKQKEASRVGVFYHFYFKQDFLLLLWGEWKRANFTLEEGASAPWCHPGHTSEVGWVSCAYSDQG